MPYKLGHTIYLNHLSKEKASKHLDILVDRIAAEMRDTMKRDIESLINYGNLALSWTLEAEKEPKNAPEDFQMQKL